MKRLQRFESVLDGKTQCEVKMYMFVFLCLIHFFPLIKGMKKETCDCLQKESADICSLLFVSLYLCLNIFHECSGLEVLRSEKKNVSQITQKL